MTNWWTKRAQAEGIRGAVSVVDAEIQRGWSSSDHLIDDSAIKQMVGWKYRNLRAAVEAASNCTGKHSSAATLVVKDAQGRKWKVDTSANFGICGRRVPALVPV
jgi:hypothetical protein